MSRSILMLPGLENRSEVKINDAQAQGPPPYMLVYGGVFMFSFLRSSLLWSQTVGLGLHGCSVRRMALLLRANLTPNLWLSWSFLNLTRVGSDGRVLFWKTCLDQWLELRANANVAQGPEANANDFQVQMVPKVVSIGFLFVFSLAPSWISFGLSPRDPMAASSGYLRSLSNSGLFYDLLANHWKYWSSCDGF